MRRAGARLRWISLSVALAGSFLLAGCSGGHPGGGSSPPKTSSDPVATALNKLGVSTRSTPRKAPNGADLPSSYAPLGTTAAYGNPPVGSNQSAMHAAEALWIAGPALATGSSAPANLVKIAGASQSGSTVHYGRVQLLDKPSSARSWAAPSGHGSPAVNPVFQSLTSAASGDLDGDGLEELAVAYVAPPETSTADPTLNLKVIQDSQDKYVSSVTPLVDAKGVTDVSVMAGDFDGNGKASIVIAVAYATGPGKLLFVDELNGKYQVDSSLTKTFPVASAGSVMYFRMAAGNIDYDRADELAVVVDQYEPSTTGARATGSAEYYVYDDANHGFKKLTSGVVQGRSSDVTYTAIAADVSLGDVDGDGLDQVVLGGSTDFDEGCGGFGQVVMVLDDAAHGFKHLGSVYNPNAEFSNCPTANPWKLYFTFVKTVDLLGTGRDAIVANQFIYDYKPTGFSCPKGETICQHQVGSGGTRVQIPDSAFFYGGGDFHRPFGPEDGAIAVGDLTADGREDIAVASAGHKRIRIYGQSEDTRVVTDGWGLLAAVSVTSTHGGPPQLVATRDEASGPVLKFVGASTGHKLVFTQPIVIAALAAPPCLKISGQNTAACVTTFGKAKSVGGSLGNSLSVSAGITFGVDVQENVPWVGDFSEIDKQSIVATATASTVHSYDLTRSVTYATSSMKDGVIFTSIPYDRYTYRIVAAADSTLVGKLVVLSLPRTPITLIADRSFYNAAVSSGSLKIGSKVFQHTIGKISSYPSQSDLARYPVALFSQPKMATVGEGSGTTQLGIAVNKQISVGQSLALSYTANFKTTGQGFVTGFQVGASTSADLTVTSGSTLTYTGTVGSIDRADYASDYYGFGLFTYVQKLGGQKFEVLNYWTKPR